MSTNISEIMFELESHGIEKPRVAEIVNKLIEAGQRSVWASLGEIAGKRLASLRDVEVIVASLVAAPSPDDPARSTQQ